MNLRQGIRGPWLGCSRFPKCRGRGKWTDVPDAKRAELEDLLAKHEKANPIAVVRTLDGKALTDKHGKPLPDAPKVDQLVTGGDPSPTSGASDDAGADEALDNAEP